MIREEIFPSPFFKSADLAERSLDLKIKSAAMETLKSPQGASERKLVLAFENHPKRLVCNRTNFDAISLLHGPNTEAWIGKSVELYATWTQFRGKETACVRVRRAS